MSWDLFSSAASASDDATAGEPWVRSVLGLDRPRGALWTVSEVNAAAREVIEGVLPPLWVAGEVTNFTRARSGHCYFSLRDANAQLRCVMWRNEARLLPTSPAEGMQVRALGRCTLYEGRGEFQLVVAEVEGRGDGLWKLALDQLRTRLEAEGLTAAHRKRPLPRSPARVGVVTSPVGAALADILAVVRRRAPWTEVVLGATRVQGDGAAEEIAAAIRRFGEAGCVDVLIVGRGGGSREDLWAFNQEVVARALAASPVPTISAVGHETDVTIADLIADHRAPTPSAAAEAAVADGAQLRAELDALRGRAAAAMHTRWAEARERTASAVQRLRDATEQSIHSRRQRLAGAAERLEALSPLATLRRGFAVPLDADGRVMRSAAELTAGVRFQLRLADGRVACRAVGPAEEDA